ncbi:MAG TPA: hypothetical protein ENF93_00105, partial [Ignisphaera sp.]|nr:hypothetical protein [Ignisphaera sp.]
MESEALPVEEPPKEVEQVEQVEVVEVEPVMVEPIEADIELTNEVAKLATRVQNIEEGIDRMKSDVADVKQKIENLGMNIISITKNFEMYSRIAEWIGSWKCTRCKFYEGGVCKAWKLAEPVAEEIKKRIGEDVVVFT